tara:strand:- start:15 stop:521 length:507 start_codon:yes stop_codon:yes gene_type:complete
MEYTKNNPIPKGFRQIPKAADHYVISPNGYVFNSKTGNFLKQQWNGYSTYTIIRDTEGKQYRFCHSNIDKKQYKPLTREWVLEVDKAKIIPEYPDYAISHYGAVYRIQPRNTGPRAGEVCMLQEFGHKGHSYVALRDPKTDHPRNVRVARLTHQLWGDEGTYAGVFRA